MKVALLTLGCRVNQSETADIKGSLRENGVTIVGIKDNPDICIINTCTVTARSDYTSRQLIRRASRTGAKVIVTGCYSQLKPEEAARIPGVSEIVDINNKFSIIKLVTGDSAGIPYGNYNRSRPYLKIQDGCNFNCSYCSVPLARGKSRSVPADEVIKRARMIGAGGYNEIVLTGIHLGSYGHDLKEKTGLGALLKNLLKQTSIHRFRLSSLEINEVDDELIELMREDRVCNHLHLPLQSGSNKILKLMRRNYSAETYAEKIEKLSSRIENISIGADIIIGFPGEGEKEFDESFSLIEAGAFSYLHVFPFSGRSGTQAAGMKDLPSQSAVKDRMERIMSLNVHKKESYMSGQMNRTLDVILEERTNDGIVAGTSANYLKINVRLKDYIKGSIANIRPLKIIDGRIEGIA
ncbi:MAG: tRNA (N(6)-L-threonylcarbamoyladenosine(37)-C(2))-methylthiotransferase MtaB, partial [Nitrospirota bacterium]|nr:tRNA (N(6)-L-threonylcarbamoyladenosine(37)-C(2))-methylthiotransferase MtaB [Nitrospirota bacterium]